MDDSIYFDEECLTDDDISNGHENELLNDFLNMKKKDKELKDGKTDVL